jgi:holo-[acyl-carrier protein] synthase
MILGVGIDMIEVKRVMEKIDRGNGFREKIFSAQEIAFCEARKNKGENYAARFAAKEAFLKATGLGLTLSHQLCDIEVCNDPNGKPFMTLGGTFRDKAIELHWNKIHVSISHLQDVACAVVILEQ